MRSPFESPMMFESLQNRDDELVAPPDENRRKFPLESFTLGELTFRGVISKSGETPELHALVRTVAGLTLVTRLGEYVGKNNGLITGISESKIDILETVPNGSGGWITRPQTLGLQGSGGDL